MNSSLEIISLSIEQLEKSLPKVSAPRRDDVFSISKFPHYEVVMSNWFSFFLNADKGHQLTGLFSNALAILLKRKGCKQSLDWLNDQVYSDTEVYTKKGNYIDFVVFDDKFKEHEYEDALIIEHKINADLYNDLKDYYNSINTNGCKQGVVLSARPIAFDDSNYLNITYLELVNELRELAGTYTLDIDMNYVSYLKDFINNLERMGTERDIKGLKFCLEHGKTIDEITTIKKKVEDELIDSIRQSLTNSEFEFYRKNPTNIALKAKTAPVTFYIQLDKLFSNKKCYFEYWISGDYVSVWNKISDHAELKKKFDGQFVVRDKKIGTEWVELLRGEFDFDKVEDLHESFEEELVKMLNDQISPINEFVKEQIKKYA